MTTGGRRSGALPGRNAISEDARERRRANCRRPIEPWEVPDLERLAAGLRTVRLAAGLTQWDLAQHARLNESTIYQIEAAVRRTRASTLRRIAEVLVNRWEPPLGDVDQVTADLVAMAGAALAPESEYAEANERARERREERERRIEEELADLNEAYRRKQAERRADIAYRKRKKAERQRYQLMTRGF
ncbi:MAG: helix-turn-helix transcriptional regulator [Acidimicrobiales bacterium]